MLSMGSISKSLTLILILIMTVSSLSILVKPANAQSIPTPSVPQFTVSYVDRSYKAPITTTQTTDPFTGQPVTHTSGGQYVENKTIDIKIKNEPYTSTTLPNGTVIQLYYSVRTKGHFADWTPVSTNGYSITEVFASTSDYTVVTLIMGSTFYVPEGGQEDFQVEANAGYEYPLYNGLVLMGHPFASVRESGWSNIQTITIPASSSSTSLTPTVPEFPTLILLIIFILVATLLGTVVIKRNQSTGWIV